MVRPQPVKYLTEVMRATASSYYFLSYVRMYVCMYVCMYVVWLCGGRESSRGARAGRIVAHDLVLQTVSLGKQICLDGLGLPAYDT